MASRPAPQRQPMPQPTPQPAAAEPAPAPAPASRPVPQPVASLAASHSRNSSSGSGRAPPPPPPAPPAAAAGPPKAKALYDFSSDSSGMLPISAGQIVQVVSKEGNGKSLLILIYMSLTNLGWWLCMNLETSAQGWSPEAYLEEQAAPAPKPAPPPPPPTAPRSQTNGTSTVAAAKAKAAPPPPAKRPNMAGRKAAPPPPAAPRDSAVSMNSQGDSSGASGRGTPNSASNASLAGGLAEALRARQSAMQGKQDDDDDW